MNGIYVALICVGAVILIALFALFIYLSNNLLKVTRYSVNSPKAEGDGVKIVQLSDLHGKEFGKDNKKLLKKVSAEKPDFIAVTGDIIHKYRKRDIKNALRFIENCSKIAPVFYVSGNHEMRSTGYRTLKKDIEAAGAVVLEGRSVKVGGVNVCGVNCADIKKGGYFNLLNGSESGVNLLLAHLPQYISRYFAAGFDVVLCGHAHGGQWRIPFTGIGIYSPGQGLFPKYTSGAHRCGDSVEIISRGLGNSQCPLRLFNCPEIVVVTINKQ